MRDAGNEGSEGDYDLEAMQQALIAEGVGKPDGRGNITGWTLFGGEPLLMPIRDIEKMLEWSALRSAPVGLQTNGTLITHNHIDLFKKFGVGIGMSVDGPEDLNDWRKVKVRPGTSLEEELKLTRVKTSKSIANLETLLREGLRPSVITTLSTFNAGTDEKVGRMIAWLLSMRDLGLKHLNFHTLEIHSGAEAAFSLSQDRQIEVFTRLRRELVGFSHISPWDDMKSKLVDGAAHCVFNFCSPYSTAAVSGVDGQGERARCGRLNNDGVSYERSKDHSYERYVALYLTPQEYGGCQGCRFFQACGGGNCPGEAEGGDWRNKTIHCKTLMAMFEVLELELVIEGKEPTSMSLSRPAREAQLLAQWTGQTPTITSMPGNRPHGDAPHGDVQHGDHTDAQGKK